MTSNFSPDIVEDLINLPSLVVGYFNSEFLWAVNLSPPTSRMTHRMGSFSFSGLLLLFNVFPKKNFPVFPALPFSGCCFLRGGLYVVSSSEKRRVLGLIFWTNFFLYSADSFPAEKNDSFLISLDRDAFSLNSSSSSLVSSSFPSLDRAKWFSAVSSMMVAAIFSIPPLKSTFFKVFRICHSPKNLLILNSKIKWLSQLWFSDPFEVKLCYCVWGKIQGRTVRGIWLSLIILCWPILFLPTLSSKGWVGLETSSIVELERIWLWLRAKEESLVVVW